jgi:hypothetical protein
VQLRPYIKILLQKVRNNKFFCPAGHLACNIVDQDCFSPVTLLSFEFYNSCKMLINVPNDHTVDAFVVCAHVLSLLYDFVE